MVMAGPAPKGHQGGLVDGDDAAGVNEASKVGDGVVLHVDAVDGGV